MLLNVQSEALFIWQVCSKYITIFMYYILHRELWKGIDKRGAAKYLFDLILYKGIKFVFTNRGLVILRVAYCFIYKTIWLNFITHFVKLLIKSFKNSLNNKITYLFSVFLLNLKRHGWVLALEVLIKDLCLVLSPFYHVIFFIFPSLIILALGFSSGHPPFTLKRVKGGKKS